MAELDREVRIAAGRRAGDGEFRLSVFAQDLLAVTLEGHGERAPTLLLTREQAERLRAALESADLGLEAERLLRFHAGLAGREIQRRRRSR